MPVYEKIKIIGRGSFGKAFLIRETQGERRLMVMKCISMKGKDDNCHKEALNEAKVLATIKPHPYIIRYYKSYVKDSELCIIMDFASGGDLHSRINSYKNSNKRISEGKIRRWLAQAILALKHLHENHILHRDLKPQNIFLNENDDLLLGDFGISKILGNDDKYAKTTIGTPFYFCPELCSGQAYSYPADIWSLGCVFFELCSMTVPFRGKDLKGLVESIILRPVPAVPSVYSSELRHLIEAMLQRDTQKRPTAKTMVEIPLIQAEIKKLLLNPSTQRTNSSYGESI